MLLVPFQLDPPKKNLPLGGKGLSRVNLFGKNSWNGTGPPARRRGQTIAS